MSFCWNWGNFLSCERERQRDRNMGIGKMCRDLPLQFEDVHDCEIWRALRPVEYSVCVRISNESWETKRTQG